jgi:hypothetical protein
VDPAFRDRKVYAAFVRRLAQSHLVSFHDRSFVEECTGLFFVKKKDGRLRLILDARRSNCHFSGCPDIALATGSSIGDIRIAEDSDAFVGHVDIANAFYNFELHSRCASSSRFRR